jgi:HPt (histidine-containing phosphotransfer) domain-containing protein
MSQTRVGPRAIHSVLASDPELRAIIEAFVADLPTRVARIERQLDAKDWSELRRTAHQLKGASGSYGFDELTPYAAGLEGLLVTGAPADEVTAAVGELIAQCRRVTAAPA